MFLPTTQSEAVQRGWDTLDVILVSGDSYIDSPMVGVAVIGRVLEAAGYRVGIIAQPDIQSGKDIQRLGEPRLFWGVSGGSVDSMIANYTPTNRKRRRDDYTPGGENNRRPDRAVIAYANLIRRYFKNTSPIVLGGIEASLRRVAHYDYWTDKVRRSILLDAKAELLVYGMAENTIRQLATALANGADYRDIRGLCYIASEAKAQYLELPSHEDCAADKNAFTEMFMTFYHNQDAITARGLQQAHGNRYLVHTPPNAPLTQKELDEVYHLPFKRAQHPFYEAKGTVKALETIRFSIPTHRGCYGECNFCAIAMHEGRTVTWRSQESILKEARTLTKLPGFKGYILDLSGPSANMYAVECDKKLETGACEHRNCLTPTICPALKIDHQSQIDLMRAIREIPGVKKVFLASGIRYDMLMADEQHTDAYLEELVNHHVSGQLKVAPEHSEAAVLRRMNKSDPGVLMAFKRKFDQANQRAGKRQFLTYYFIAAHPGCSEAEMRQLSRFVSKTLRIHPQQVQIFTPTPSTISSLMYYTEKDPFNGEKIFVEKNLARKDRQKQIITG
ncbi:MAG: YgiQ family radical SAM protein [Anaerolineae bacterium]|nr:YgiQ family radical SAM protein [Anaerolineae bacterium]